MRTSFALLAVFLAACSASSASTSTGAESEVNVSQCPTSIRLSLSKPYVFPSVQTEAFGTVLSKTELEREQSGMTEANALDALTIEAGNLVKDADTCSYSQGDDVKVVLRTNAAGTDRLDITKGKFSAYAYPTAYAPEGLRFGADPSVAFYVQIAADPGGDRPTRSVRIGSVQVRTTGEQIAPPPSATLRVPVLDEAGGFLHDTDASFPKTIVLDAYTGADQFSKLGEKAEDMQMYGSPNDYVTKDASTSLCWDGPADGVCDLFGSLTDNVFGDMFGFAEDDDGNQACKATETEVTMTFYMSESDSTSEATIPRCAK